LAGFAGAASAVGADAKQKTATNAGTLTAAIPRGSRVGRGDSLGWKEETNRCLRM
jgi:hypothetical protein